MKKDKKKIIIITITIIIAGILGITIYENNKIIEDNTSYRIKQKEIEVYSNIKISDLIELLDGKINDNKVIDTKTTGEKEITFFYHKKDKRTRKGTFTIQIKDTEEPLVWLANSYSVKVGSKIDLASTILCADNYDKKPECKIEGDYDLNKAGNYRLTYVATDNSNNTQKVDFTLYVYEPKKTTTKTTTATNTAFKDVLTNYKSDNTSIGIDVSKWQEEIDFKKVKAAGAEFVMIRVGAQKGVEGEYILDSYFKKNIENATKEGLKVGIYFYSYANSEEEAQKQAKWVIKQIKKYNISLPVAFDWECYQSFNEMELSLFGLNQVANAFLDTIKQHGYEAMLYGSKNYLKAIWKYQSANIWLAHYTKQTDYDADYVMWQLCQDGKIDGIKTDVDIDILYQKEKVEKKKTSK